MKRLALFPLLVLFLLFAACERTETAAELDDSTTFAQSETSVTAPPPAPPAGAMTETSGVTAPRPAPTEVSLVDHRIEMPATLVAGQHSFHVTNNGRMPHAFEIEGEGIEQKTETLGPGQSRTIVVALEPGTYRVYCPVADHAEAHGMEMQLTVTPAVQ
jgi:uncharacterized cupredoxin-like copper-binding protein